MFNGLIREIAVVKSYTNNILRLKADFKPNLGDSIAVNGACLSVIEIFDDGFSVELSLESRKHIATENLKGKVHIEPAMKLGDRIDGHLVQGHIDAIGEVYKISQNENGVDVFIKLPQEIMKFMANKGSVCVDGVSLTVNEVLQNAIKLTIIPITFKESLFCDFKIGRRVNIESDMMARYIARQIEFKKELTWEKVDNFLSLY
ncbi:riboflavin synthase [Campylobacter pinnipediorum]|uniref:Riboflavin synthase n=1 Tax=Campylobacter pinnipediorum subsp. pinnipediorum TaxID=1660067 RepID=A0AAX0LA49_9BACT|nr:riboflavin synthase [Campylobacter pinnipediorum]AQW82859.1 6,7-dimethyl-8-ribityllumazine synthase (riboflavin synthase, alpha subunit) [Campylobacter pinnipediorum subsp. pinnipediorum]OPA78026.1 riboflavin synthase subunit alpha [Campylobacter pinnipediorum subsp. pinnipediorum]